MMKLDSKSFTRAGELFMPSIPFKLKNVPAISSNPPINPQYLKHDCPHFSTNP